jgi:hypothetical protein
MMDDRFWSAHCASAGKKGRAQKKSKRRQQGYFMLSAYNEKPRL